MDTWGLEKKLGFIVSFSSEDLISLTRNAFVDAGISQEDGHVGAHVD